MAASGTATIDFGATPTDTAVVTVPMPGIASNSHVEAFFMSETSADNDTDEHAEANALCPLTCGPIVPGGSGTCDVTAHPIAALGIGQFTFRWVWA